MNKKKIFFHISALLGAILLVLLFGTFRKKPIPVPVNDNHRPLLVKLGMGFAADEVIGECRSCHNPEKIPLSADHPAGEKCLACHPVQG